MRSSSSSLGLAPISLTSGLLRLFKPNSRLSTTESRVVEFQDRPWECLAGAVLEGLRSSLSFLTGSLPLPFLLLRGLGDGVRGLPGRLALALAALALAFW